MLFGKEMIDMVPSGTIQDLVRSNGAEVLQMVITAARTKYELAPDERISFQFIEHRKPDGQPTVILLPQVLTDKLVLKRKLPYFDVIDFLRTAPIAEYITQAKSTAKLMGKLEPMVVSIERARADGDTKKLLKLEAQLTGLLAQLPPSVADALGLGAAAAPAPAQLSTSTTAVDVHDQADAATGDTKQLPPANGDQ